ncbi:MAG: hypothetical protein OEZ47_16400, partial [Gammaproteobacteria bacterium]|nr:hypothetical protein [Gammaproteobacteria bacterium]
GAVGAKAWSEGWIFSPSAGISNPALGDIYQYVFNAPFIGKATIQTDAPQDSTGEVTFPSQKFFFENPLPRSGFKPEGGLEFRRVFGGQHDFIVGVSTWETVSKSVTNVVFPIEGQSLNEAIYERRGTFSYTQYYLGWRFYLGERTRRFNLYLGTSLHELFDIDYKENHVFDFISGEPAGFKKIVIYRTQATGLLSTQLTGGAEFRFTDRFSASFEASYMFRLLGGAFRNVSGESDISENADRVEFEINKQVIYRNPLTGKVEALSPDGESHNPIKLDLDGWRFMFRFNVAF